MKSANKKIFTVFITTAASLILWYFGKEEFIKTLLEVLFDFLLAVFSTLFTPKTPSECCPAGEKEEVKEHSPGKEFSEGLANLSKAKSVGDFEHVQEKLTMTELERSKTVTEVLIAGTGSGLGTLASQIPSSPDIKFNLTAAIGGSTLYAIKKVEEAHTELKKDLGDE